MDLVQAAVLLLDESFAFQSLYNATITHNAETNATTDLSSMVIPIDVNIDVVFLMDVCLPLAVLVTDHASESVLLFQQIVCEAAAALQLFQHSTLHPSQILVRLNVHNLASQCAVWLGDSCVSAAAHSYSCGQLVSCSGVLTAVASATKYLECCRHVCLNVQCGEDLVRTHFPGRSQHAGLRPGVVTTCPRCGSDLKEDVTFRRYADLIAGYVVCLESLESGDLWRRQPYRYQAMRCHFRGERGAGLHLGGRYLLTGCVVVHQGAWCLEVFSVKPVPLSVFVQPHIYHISAVIEKLYHDRRFSPWSFVLSLAFVLASEVSSVGTFFRLKLGILISLVACSSLKFGQRLPLLAVTSCCSAVRPLLQLCARLSRRHLLHPAGSPLIGTYRAADKSTEAGSLLLARGGVCLLGDIGNMKNTVLEQLQKALETGSAVISSSADTIVHSHSVLAQVWALCDVTATAAGDTTNTGAGAGGDSPLVAGLLDTRRAATRGRLSRALLESFGIVYTTDVVDADDDAAVTDIMISDILAEAAGTRQPVTTIPLEDIKNFLAFAGDRCLEMEPEAESLVRGYFVASRRFRTAKQPDVPVAAVSTITSVAHALAQLSLADYVGKEHVTLAVLLYEESLVACYGQSPLGVRPLIHLGHAHLDQALGRQNDERMYEFYECLNDFSRHWTGD